MRRKAFVTILEMLTVIATLLIAFSVLFPGFSYQNRWEQAYISLKGRDAILAMDRIDRLYSHSFDDSLLISFLDRALPTNITNLVHWSGAQGAIKPIVTVACNCTDAQKNALISWIGKMRMNGRDIDFDIVSSSLDPIYAPADVLLIWGDKDLTTYKASLENYLKTGKGIVELMDLESDLDVVQTDIFGLEKCDNLFGPGSCGVGGQNEDTFIRPDNVARPIYQGYKYFHHMPMSVRAPTSVTSVPAAVGLPPCTSTNVTTGAFNMRETPFNFWICNGASVYFDTGGDPNEADIVVLSGQQFPLDGQNLLLSYIDGTVKIGVTFLSGYAFENFLDANTRLFPRDGDVFKILLSKGNYSGAGSLNPHPAVIVNGTISRRAWISDFSNEPDLNGVDDDHKMLLASVLHWASDKKFVSGLSSLRLGHLTSYVNVANQDMYEVYEFQLGLGFPF